MAAKSALPVTPPSNACIRRAQTACSRSYLPWLLIACLLVYLPLLGSYKIIEPSDGFYTEAAREMLECGNFIVPQLNYEPFYDKPIFIYWLIIAAYKLIGVSTFAARLPSALSAIGMCLSTFVFVRSLIERRAAVSAAVILCTSLMLVLIGHVALIDTALSLMTEISALSFFLALETPKKHLLWLGYSAIGIGFLLKGPVILVLVGGTIIGYLLATRRASAIMTDIKRLKPFPGLALAALIAAPWYILAGIATHGAFLLDFFVNQNVMRALGHMKLSHAQPIYFYVPIFFAGSVPWTWLPLVGWRNPARLLSRRLDLSLAEKLALFCLVWSAFVCLFFSSLTSKMGTYILPMLPAFSILCGITLDRLLTEYATNRRSIYVGSLSNCLLLIAAFYFAWRYLQPDQSLGMALIAALASYIAANVAFSILVAVNRIECGLALLLALNLLGSAIIGPSVMLGYYNHRMSDYEAIIHEAAAHDGDLAQAIAPRASIGFYLRRPAPCIDDVKSALKFMHSGKGPHLVVVYRSAEPWILTFPTHEEIARRGSWSLYRIEDANNVLMNNYLNCLRQLEDKEKASQ